MWHEITAIFPESGQKFKNQNMIHHVLLPQQLVFASAVMEEYIKM